MCTYIYIFQLSSCRLSLHFHSSDLDIPLLELVLVQELVSMLELVLELVLGSVLELVLGSVLELVLELVLGSVLELVLGSVLELVLGLVLELIHKLKVRQHLVRSIYMFRDRIQGNYRNCKYKFHHNKS